MKAGFKLLSGRGKDGFDEPRPFRDSSVTFDFTEERFGNIIHIAIQCYAHQQ